MSVCARAEDVGAHLIDRKRRKRCREAAERVEKAHHLRRAGVFRSFEAPMSPDGADATCGMEVIGTLCDM